MAKATMYVMERVLIAYEVTYDEYELEASPYKTLETFVEAHMRNPWQALNLNTIITDIQHDRIEDYVDIEEDSVQFTY